tara:strand:- start:393 stop:587 length:195 start_codon:yes stop_codon:yes gene_type:complete
MIGRLNPNPSFNDRKGLRLNPNPSFNDRRGITISSISLRNLCLDLKKEKVKNKKIKKKVEKVGK